MKLSRFTLSNFNVAVQVLGLIFFSVLFGYAWLFYKERMLTFDPAFFSFRIIQQKNFDIELGRWGTIGSQILPLIALKAGYSLTTFLRTYSVSFILIYYLIFLTMTLLLKTPHAGVALMFSLCITFRHSFYYSTAELYVGIAICILIWAFVSKLRMALSFRPKVIWLFLSFLFIYIASYCHQLTLLAILFIILFEIVNEKEFRNPWLLTALTFLLTWFFIRVFLLTNSVYENEKIPQWSVFKNQLPNLFHLPSYIYFTDFAKSFLRPLFLLTIVTVAIIVKQKKWYIFNLLFFFTIGFLLLDLITYYKGESPLMYENYLTLLGLFPAVVFCGSLKQLLNKRLFLFFIVILLAWNLKSIYYCHSPFTAHVQYLERLTTEGHKYSEKKYLIEQRNFPWAYAWIDWALPFETLIYSSLSGPDSSITVECAPSINQYDSLLQWKNIFLGPRWSVTWFWTNDLNSRYFHLPSTGYKKLASAQSDTLFHESMFTRDNLTIEAQSVTTQYNDSIVIPLKIINWSGCTLNSIPDNAYAVQLGYRIFNENYKLLFQDGHRTVLETDVQKESQQGLIIADKLIRGNYFVDVDFVTENKRWWGINSRFKLTVN